MDSRKKTVSHRANAHLSHRTNDLVLGHVGMLTYIPVGDAQNDDEEASEFLGELTTSRIINDAPTFHEVVPLTEWFPRSVTGESLKPPTSGRGQKSQERWLFRTCPEAFMGNVDLKSDVKVESRAAARDDQSGSGQRMPLLSTGEITDATNPTRPASCQALAMASGEAGDVLRVVKLEEDHRHWGQNHGSPSLKLAEPGASYEGFWCERGIPITQVKFTQFSRRRSAIRWLLVQTALSTMVFHPQIQRVPAWAEIPDGVGGVLSKVAYISVLPVSTVSASQTGGLHHCDVSFNPGSAENPCQLAIIDAGGNWSVWEITGNIGTRNKPLQPVLRFSGRIYDGPPADPSRAFTLATNGEHCHITWVTPAEKRPLGRRRVDDFNSSPESSFPNFERLAEGVSGHSETLLLCSRRSLKVFDIQDSDGEAAIFVEVVPPKKTDTIVDVSVCPTDGSLMFVLTSTSVFWLELTSNPEQDKLSATILLSCPHLRNAIDGSLQMTVTHIPNSGSPRNWLVCVYSSLTPRVTIFSFTLSSTSSCASPTVRQASFSHCTFHLDHGDEESQLRLRSLLIAHPSLVYPQPGGLASLQESGLLPGDCHFTQFLVLNENFSLVSGAYAITCQENCPIPSLHRDRAIFKREAEAKRKALFKNFRDAFVVNDDLAKILDPGGPKNTKRRVLQSPETLGRDWASRPAGVLDLSPVMRLVAERVVSKVGSLERTTLPNILSRASLVARQAVQDGLVSGGLHLTTLFDIVARSGVILEPSDTASDWADELQRLRESAPDRVQVTNLAGPEATLDMVRVFGRFMRLWTSSLSEAVLRPAALEAREAIVAYISAHALLSQVGICIVPESLVRKKPQEPPADAADVLEIGLPSPSPSVTLASSPGPSDSASQTVGEAVEGNGDVKEPEQDEITLRLGKYAVSIGIVPRRKEESILLSHWPKEPGSDPHQFTWAWGPDTVAERTEASQRMREARHQRRFARRAALGLSVEPSDLAAASTVPSTQPNPRIAHSSQVIQSSQPRVGGDGGSGSSSQQQQWPQSQGSQSQGLHIMSQPVDGRHGARIQTQVGKRKKFQSSQGFGRPRGFR